MRLLVSNDNRNQINSSNDDIGLISHLNQHQQQQQQQRKQQQQKQYDKLSLFSSFKSIKVILSFGVLCCTLFCFVSLYWYETIITIQQNQNHNHDHYQSNLLKQFIVDDRIGTVADSSRQNNKNDNRMLSLIQQQSKSNSYNESNNNNEYTNNKTEWIRSNRTVIINTNNETKIRKQLAASTAFDVLQSNIIQDNKQDKNNSDFHSPSNNQQQQQQEEQQEQELPVYQKIQNFDQYKGTLNCTMYGGPYNPSTVLDNVIYWKYVPADYTEFDSPLRKTINNDIELDIEEEEITTSSADDIAKDDEEVIVQHRPTNKQSRSQSQTTKQYLTFELDNGGFNNIRMAFETIIAIAIASGRILVIPPKYIDWYDDVTESYYGLNDIFVLQQTKSFQYITFDTFLQTVVIEQQYVRHPITNEPIGPPQNKYYNNNNNNNNTTTINWDNLLSCAEGHHKGYGKVLWKNWFHKYIPTLEWNNDKCIGSFPSERGNDGVQRLNETLQNILYYENNHYNPIMTWKERKKLYTNHPTNVNRSTFSRLRELLVDRTELCIYNTYYQNLPILHIHSEGDYRMLTQFYSSLFIENYQLDLHIKRYIRDNVRYNDNIQCLAGQVIETIQSMQSSVLISNGSTDDTNNNSNSIVDFDTIHFRRDDFETVFPEAFITVEEMLINNTYYMIDDNRTVYIATDEKDLSIFNILRENYNILFLKDCLNYQNSNKKNKKINSLYYGPIDQLVAAYGTTFIGTLLSTFTGYINRIRGYHSSKCNTDTTTTTTTTTIQCTNVNTTTGRINSYYAIAENSEVVKFRTMMFYYTSVDNPSWYREFPIGWRDIDHDFILIINTTSKSSNSNSAGSSTSNISTSTF